MAHDRRPPTGGLLGLLAGGMAICCGLPVLLGAGIAVGVVGVAIGSAAVVVAGAALGLWGWRRRRAARSNSRDAPSSD